MPENRVFFIINRYAGTSFQSAVEGRIINACGLLKLECTIEYTNHKGHATELARQAVANGFTRVFAMGGDGTVNEVAQGLIHTSTALGIIPKGSGNGLARHLQIPLSVPGALELLDQHQVIQMDTLLINRQLSVNVSGIGFDAHVASQFGLNGKRGLLNYIKLVAREFSQFREFDALVTLGKETWTQKSFIISLANSSQFGNNVRVAPLASVRDGEVEVCFIRKAPLGFAISIIIKMFIGKPQHSQWVDVRKARQFRAVCPEPVAFHIDGEAHPPAREFNVEIQPASLKMIVPATAMNL
jgi:diacylglycerol kinase (ATP)